ncbi:hypothetical protein [Candidatus Thiodiazotropha sp. CDECU1]|uniref:hypothetical protein n=1 Tax=Candidatus Thiodiazotropha sp. CDECU1 TaxID=3065865 RepID=UPI00292F1D78|nr:hypothetical protein [Candidatus Thiodiazotropha sp. CDECU1]
MNMETIKSLSIFRIYMLFAVIGIINFAISILFVSPEMQSFYSIFAVVTAAFLILGGILAWFAQSGHKWAMITFGIYCVYRICDYFWGYLYRDALPQSFIGWVQAFFVVFAWTFLLWLIVSKGSNKRLWRQPYQ